MIQIALLLFGTNLVRRHAYLLGIISALWFAVGLVIFIDGLDGVRYFPLKVFGGLLLIESIITLSVASTALGAQKAVLYFKGVLFCVVAGLILSGLSASNILLGVICGFAYFMMGVMQIASAWVVRFPQWRTSLAGGIGLLAFAIYMFIPYPSYYAATISSFIGMTMMVGGFASFRVFLRARRLRDGASLFDLFAPSDLLPGAVLRKTQPKPGGASTAKADRPPLIVHVWTPEGSSKNAPVPRPVINRYIAAVDAQGVISTGHAAMELAPSTYISLYPGVEIDRSPSEFFRLLKATKENDVPGRYLPDYPTESAAWCPSNWQIRFDYYNRDSLLNFWDAYRQQEIYNLTYRNCSSTVAYALEAALDGALAERGMTWRSVLRTFLMPELWIAAQVRKRAQTMAWTPGLTLDYARALRVIVQPVRLPWFYRFLRVIRRVPESVTRGTN